MKVLSIGSDRNLFIRDSEAQKRIKEYGTLFDELHIIVFADKTLGRSDSILGKNIFIYPTNHRYKLSYMLNIHAIAGRIFRKYGKDFIISCQDPFEAGFAGWLLSRWLKVPLQIQVHTDIFSRYFSAESFMSRLRVVAAELLLPRADGIRVVSERIAQSLKKRNLKLKAAPVVLPVFVDVQRIQSARIRTDLHKKYPDHDCIILAASRLTKEKNLGMAIEAMAEVVKKLPMNPLLLIVGDGPEREKLKGACQKLQIAGSVTFEPWSDDLISYYKTADLFLLTSNYEGYGRTVVEAMAAGTPVIMTDVGLAGELLINDLDGIVIAVNDVKELETAMLQLLENGAKKDSLKDEAIKVAQSLPSKGEYLSRYKQALASLVLKTHV